MSTLFEIEAAALQLPFEEQQELLAKLEKAIQHAEAVRNDPFLELIERLERDTPLGETTNIAANYKEVLYGHPSNE